MKKTKTLLMLTTALLAAVVLLLAACGPTLESISASYNAVPNPGNEINRGHSEIQVTAHYADGSEEVIESGWEVENPGNLVGGQTNTFTITYQGQSCELVIDVISEERQDYSNLTNTPDE